METEDGSQDIVHPEVRAHITSLISALGGASAEDDGRYKLGDDALEVLRDLKRWIRFYDEKTNRMDVARCMADANLVEGDLLPILAVCAAGDETAAPADEGGRYRARIVLACLELLVPLTWPPDSDPERMTVNHHRHGPTLRRAQTGYKRAIINYDASRVLGVAARAAMPAMAVSLADRTGRDRAIIGLALFFLRNIAMIGPPLDGGGAGDDDNKEGDNSSSSPVSRSSTIDAFAYQEIFLVLLAIASNMGDDFRTEDVIVLEIVFHLVKRVDPASLFVTEQQRDRDRDRDLSNLMAKEAALLGNGRRSGPRGGRHNRFGAMVWVKRNGNQMRTVSGTDAVVDAATRQRRMDSTKVYRPPRRPRRGKAAADAEAAAAELGPPPRLNNRAIGQLRVFVEDFLDASFNPLFRHVRRTIDSDAPHLLHHHRRQFFYLAAWFLRAERARQQQQQQQQQQRPVEAAAENEPVDSFSLVAAMLSQEMFVTLSRALHSTYAAAEWADLTAVMRCFTEILRTVQEMSECGRADDEDIADNILARLFYEDATHDCVAAIARTYKDQDFEYLDAATELAHHFLRVLEAYSKRNVDMQVRSRRARRKKKAKKNDSGENDNDNDAAEDEKEAGEDDQEEEEEDANAAERIARERKFDFGRFATRFCAQGVVNTFVALIKHYRDLDDEQLKRAHRYLYRVAFKQQMSVMLFRVDIIHLLHGMIRGPEPLDRGSPLYAEWEELIRHLLGRCVRKIQERPALIIEMLFSKMPSTVYYLENGRHPPLAKSAATPRPAAELEFRNPDEPADRKIGIVVGIMLDRGEANLVGWVREVLARAEGERRAWAAAESGMDPIVETDHAPPAPPERPAYVVRAADPAGRTAMFKNGHLRLLMRLCSITREDPGAQETTDSAWIIAGSVPADELSETCKLINQAEFSPIVFEEGVLAEDQLRRKPAPRRRRAAFDDDDDDDNDDDEPLFPAGGPTARRVIDGDKGKATTSRRKRRRGGGDSGEEGEAAADSEVEKRRRRRREKERERASRVKSAMFVTASDDESDEEYDREFFAREEEIRQRAQRVATTATAAEQEDLEQRSRRAAAALDSMLANAMSDVEISDDGEGMVNGGGKSKSNGKSKSKSKSRLASRSSLVGEGGDGDVTMAEEDEDEDEEDNGHGDDDDDDEGPVARRPRIRGGFLVGSDSDE